MTVDFIEIYPKILVYPNSIDNPRFWIDDFLKKEESKLVEWGLYGRIYNTSQFFKIYDEFPNYEDFIKSYTHNSDYPEFAEEYGKSLYKNTEHWLSIYPMELDNWAGHPPSIGEYVVDKDRGHSQTFSMAYHSDESRGEESWPGHKFEITSTLYLNDDYDQGEICFLITEEDGSDTRFSYKPKAGEMMIFPARAPYFHAVKRAFNMNRYIARAFWKCEYLGDQSWHDGVEEYGIEKWNELKQIEIAEYRRKHVPNPENYANSYNRDNEKLGLNSDGTTKG
jgi:hypothetical protein